MKLSNPEKDVVDKISDEAPRMRRWPIVLTGLAVLFVFSLVYFVNPRFLSAIVLQSQDVLLADNAVPPQSGKVLLVDIDDSSLAAFGQWPWPRFRLAQLIDLLWDEGAAVIAVDVGFKEPDSFSREQLNRMWRELDPDLADDDYVPRSIPDFDGLLAQALARGASVLGLYIHLTRDPVDDLTDDQLIPWRGSYIERGRGRHHLLQGSEIDAPIKPLRDRTMLGFFNATPDHDNIVRRTPLVIAVGGIRLYPALGLEAVRLAWDAPHFEVHYDTTGVAGVSNIRVGKRDIPTDHLGTLTVNFRSERFPTLRAIDLLEGNYYPAQIRDKIIVIGTSSIGLTDIYTTPRNEEMAGAEIHATIIDNLLAGDILSEPRWMFFVNLAALFIGGLLLIGVVARTRALLSLLVLIFAIAYPVAISMFLLRYYSWIFVPSPLMMGWALTYAAVTVMKYWQQEIIAQYDARLRSVNRQLADEIQVRTAAEKEANDARNAALRAAAAKSEFLANMSHEIRTPMNSVIGMSDLALRTGLTDQQRNYIGKVRYSAHALLRLINDILDFSKLEAGRVDIERTGFNLDAVLGDIVDLLGPQASKKGLELILDCDPSIPHAVVGDPLRLRQVLINLAANAIKFTEKGHVILKVSSAGMNATATDLRFEIIDTGIGLTPEQQAGLFQAFQQADASTTRKYGGTGLGLAISQNLVNLMGGEIKIDSRAGKGSNFHFQLPFEITGGKTDAVVNLPESLRGRRVLVAGNQPVLLDILMRDCRFLGLQVESLPDPEMIPERLNQAQSDGAEVELLILDTAGIDVSGLLARLPVNGQGTPVAVPPTVMIAPPDFEQESAVATGGFTRHYLAKPVKYAAMVSTLRVAWGQDPLPFAVLWQETTTPAIADDRLKGAQVLLVDDNAINREVATENMSVYGIRVVSAVNGREAIEKARSQPWNLILMDVQMPEMDGYDATRAIRQMERDGQAPRPHTPILAMTANAMQEDQDKCHACGMDDYLSKPIDIDVFLAKLLQYIPREEIPLPGACAPYAPEQDTAAGFTPIPEETAAASPSQPVAGDDLPVIPDADVAAGLKRLRGNTQLYRRLLVDFAVSHRDAPSLIRQAAEKSEFEVARDMAHAIKGSAANLGLNGIQRAATEIDQRFRRNETEQAAELVDALDQALRGFLEAVKDLLPDGDQLVQDAGSATLALSADTNAAMQQLIEELRQGNAEALDLFNRLDPALRAAGVTSAAIETLAQAIETFDFDAAALQLKQLTQAS